MFFKQLNCNRKKTGDNFFAIVGNGYLNSYPNIKEPNPSPDRQRQENHNLGFKNNIVIGYTVRESEKNAYFGCLKEIF